MKIGRFSNKHGMPVDTVRYYVEIGLLTPERDGKNYVFGASDEEDIEFITELKSYRFPIAEISRIMALRRFLNIKDIRFTDILREKCLHQLEELRTQIARLEDCAGNLQKKINSLEEMPVQRSILGVPLSFLHYMRCPRCGKEFRLENTLIHHGQIVSAQTHCSCGYELEIRNGVIYMQEDCCSHHAQEPVKSFPFWDNGYIGMTITRLEDSGYKRINACMRCYSDCYNWLKMSKVYRESSPLIMTSEDNCGRFLTFYLANIRECQDFLQRSTIIMYMNTEERLLAAKKLLESLGMNLNLVFILGSSYCLPVADHSVDIYVDDNSSFDYYGRNSGFILDTLLTKPYFKLDFEAVGIIVDDFGQLQRQSKNGNGSKLLADILSCRDSDNLHVKLTSASNKYDKSGYDGRFITYYYKNSPFGVG